MKIQICKGRKAPQNRSKFWLEPCLSKKIKIRADVSGFHRTAFPPQKLFCSLRSVTECMINAAEPLESWPNSYTLEQL